VNGPGYVIITSTPSVFYVALDVSIGAKFSHRR